MRVFVTGGNGFIGSAAVKALTAAEHEVVCLLRSSSKTDRLEGLSYEKRLGDVRDLDSLVTAMEGCDAVIHLAGVSSWDDIDSPLLREVFIDGTANVLSAARRHGHRVVHVSSVAAVGARSRPEPMSEDTSYDLDGDPELTYSHAKHEAEELCRAAARQGDDVVTVCPSETYGPEDTGLVTAGNLVDFAGSNPVFVCPGGTSVAHVEDVAAATVSALEKGKAGERYLLGGDNLTHRQLAELTLELVGKKARIVNVPAGVLKAMTRTATKLRLPLPYNPKVVPYATRYWFVDNSKATRELGASFRSARDTLAPTVAWLQEAGHIS